MLSRCGALVLATTVALATRSAGVAAFPSSRLLYARGEGAESCPDESAMRRAVATRLGYDPFFPAADKTIHARIVRDRGELRGVVELVDARGIEQGRREFKTSPDQCEELAATMALAISIAIDPTSATTAPQARPPPVQDRASPEEAPKPETSQPPPVAPPPGDRPLRDGLALAPEGRRPLELSPGLAITLGLGTAPTTAVGFVASLGVRRGSMSLTLEGRRDLPASIDLVPGPGTITTSIWAVGLAPCLHPNAAFFCAVGSLGALRGEGTGLVSSRAGAGLHAAVGARVGVEVPIFTGLFFRPQVDLLAALARAEVTVDGRSVWKTPSAAVIGAAGIAGRFP
jgi:hypothetical protein